MTDKIRPSHYQIQGRKECFEEMLDLFGVEFTRAFCLLNVQKYAYRHEEKNGAEDIQKAKAYKQKYLDLGGKVENVWLIEDNYGIDL